MDLLIGDLARLKIWQYAKLLEKMQELTSGVFHPVKRINADQGFLRKVLFHHKYLISAGADKSIKVWRLKDFSLCKTLEGHKGVVYKLLVIRYNNRDLLLSSSADRTLKLWDLKTFTLKKTLIGHTNTPQVVRFVKERGILISGDLDGAIYVWNVKKGELVLRFKTDACEIWSLFYEASSNEIVVGSKGSDSLYFYDLFGRKKTKEIELSNFTSPHFVKFIFEIGSVKMGGASDEFYLCSGTNNLAIFNKDIQKNSFKILKGHTNQIRSFVYSEKLGGVISASCDRSLRFWKLGFDEKTQEIFYKEEQNFESAHSDNINCVAIDEKEQFMASCSWDGTIVIYTL